MHLNVAPESIAEIEKYLAAIQRKHGIEKTRRVIEAVRFNLDPEAEPPSDQRALLFFFPGLEPKDWYEPDYSPELRKICDAFQNAFEGAKHDYLAEARPEELLPYEEQIPTARSLRTKDKSTEVLLGKDKWGTFSLRANGKVDEKIVARCPNAAALMNDLDRHLPPGGTFFYSVLGPGSHILPHFDATNIRITVHLGISIPEKCAIRVNSITKVWEEGKCIFFDSTFMHEVWNKSADKRVLLMADIWNPQLTLVEREVLGDLYKNVFRE